MLDLLILLFGFGALVPGFYRWIRVAQREHYLPSRIPTVWISWWTKTGHTNLALGAASVACALVAFASSGPLRLIAVCVSLACVTYGPEGLSIKGETSKLVWTPRATRLSAITLSIILGGLVIFGGLVAAIRGNGTIDGWARTLTILVLAVPILIDLAVRIALPTEHVLSEKFVKAATKRLRDSKVDCVAITGSYGKTSTKNMVLHLVGDSIETLISPRSFNNRNGLATAVNEYLAPGTRLFVAEMGTYGTGEIGDMVSWVQPRIGVLLNVGPVHLDRMKDEAGIAKAKAEIFNYPVKIAVINVSNYWTQQVSARLYSAPEFRHLERIIEFSTDRNRVAEIMAVRLENGQVGVKIGDAKFVTQTESPLENVAAAIAVASALELEAQLIVEKLPTLPVVAHRAELKVTESGLRIIDDTFNANPESVKRALGALAEQLQLSRLSNPQAKCVVVTPGIVEMGNRQYAENRQLGIDAAEIADFLIVVKRVNQQAITDGAAQSQSRAIPANVLLVESRGQAVEWVRNNCTNGDCILYLNDLPDHYW